MGKGQELPFRSTLDDSDFEAKMRRMEKTGKEVASKVGGGLKNLAAPILALGPAIAATFTGRAIASGVHQIFDAAEALGDLSDQTGVSVGRLAVLGKAFGNAGLEVNDVGTAINRMQKFLVGIGETGEEGGALGKLGLSAKTLASLRPEQQLIAIGKAITGIRSPAERVNVAMQLFGKSGGRLIAAFNDPMFSAAGGPLTGKAALLERNAEKFAEISIKLNRASGVLKTFYAGAAEGISGALENILDRVLKIDLTAAGKKFGDALATGATVLNTTLDRLEKFDGSRLISLLGGKTDDKLSENSKALIGGINARFASDAKTFGPLLKAFQAATDPKEQEKFERLQNIKAARQTVDADESTIRMLEDSLSRKTVGNLSLEEKQVMLQNNRAKLRADAAVLMDLMQSNVAAAPAAAVPVEGSIVVTPKFKGTSLDLSSAEISEKDHRSYTGARDADVSMFNSSADWQSAHGFAGTSLVGGGLLGGGLGGAYGQTGNIWHQMSGRAGGSSNHMAAIATHAAATAGHTKKIADSVAPKGGGGGSGAVTVTQ